MTNRRESVTDYYKELREVLVVKSGTFLTLTLPKDLERSLYKLCDNQDFAKAYTSNSLTEQHWAKIKQECALYDSPLMKALR